MNDNGLSSDSLTVEELAGIDMLTQEGEATPVSEVLYRFYGFLTGKKVLYKAITVIVM